MDAFYASVEQRDDPRLRGRAVLVGAPSKRSVVLAASYEARPSGARSAMPMAEAMRRCPNALVVPPRRERYEEVSAEVFAIFRRFTPLVEGLSLDEAFLDVTRSQSLFGDGEAIARKIKDAIKGELGLTASAGVSPCKFAAKVASDLRKPDALVVVPHDDVAGFLAPLPVERMWGVGPKTAPRMRELGYATLGDLARADARDLERVLGSWGRAVQELARGVDDREVIPDGVPKSIGAEQTYDEDLTEKDAIAATLLDHTARVAQRMLREGYRARSVTVKVKYSDFRSCTRRRTVEEPICDTTSIFEIARALLERIPLDGARVRLTGVSVGDLVEPQELERPLFPDGGSERGRAIEEVIKDVGDRFGKAALTRATLLK